eukprot:TRINITY_DN453_c0_g1_i3.p1 TRINITY_DN453_c0_g1~~TRINITY_DN453_c0_g1_i3.p1  ORF type:complete len:385 (-),score=63.16 TRINITY_DN453_c0_g1_i3:17-1171(-)
MLALLPLEGIWIKFQIFQQMTQFLYSCCFQKKKQHAETGNLKETPLKEFFLQERISFYSKKGTKPGPNQDDYVSIVVQLPESDCKSFDQEIFMGVFDGHGDNGHLVSNMAQRLFPKMLFSHKLFKCDPAKAIEETFSSVEGAIESIAEKTSCQGLIKLSGTTATVALIRKDKVYIGHVGDSRALHSFSKDSSSRSSSPTNSTINEDDNIYITETTIDHSPVRFDEKERIELSGGEVRRAQENLPWRVYKKNSNKPGLAMSRSIGDIEAQKYGVSYKPEVKVLNIKNKGDITPEFIIIASDGIWEVMSNEDIAKAINFSQGKKNISENLVRQAVSKWQRFDNRVMDDITVVAHKLKQSQYVSYDCLLYTSPSPRDLSTSRMPSSA